VTVSFIVPTVGRPSLLATLRSIDTRPGDEILLVGNRYRVRDDRVRYVDCEPGGDWGHTERNVAQTQARGQYVAHIDDDDLYAPGARDLMQHAIETTPGRPVLFRMQFPNGITLWRDPKLYCGNVGTPMMLLPNTPEKFSTWEPFVGGDCKFLETSGWDQSEFVWRPEIVALLGHNT
jgi:hypothetical protein